MSFFKTLGLTALALILVLFVLNISVYQDWWKNRILNYWEFKKETADMQSDSIRAELRYGNDLIVPKNLAQFFAERKIENPVLLLPPNELVQKEGIDFSVSEPSVFYFYSGLKSVWSTNKTAKEANWALLVRDGTLDIMPLTTAAVRDSMINYYNQFKYLP